MDKTSTPYNYFSFNTKESEAGMRRRVSTGAMPGKHAVANILNYARASMVVTTKSAGHIIQVLN